MLVLPLPGSMPCGAAAHGAVLASLLLPAACCSGCCDTWRSSSAICGLSFALYALVLTEGVLLRRLSSL